ncbi:hypothetical protein QFC22_005138 [Naganishia vaughanmartiniae]|uniref:Uncharacterized protein n=1 Tax=Naganishia vaughanmartiniae TaxID=1424756 RepID=A0ACC2WVB7_9TREE|nr:hypothetical protein QFC22_005138 [Naganishia vaughanmartiniae]
MLANNIPVLTATLFALLSSVTAVPLSTLLEKRASGQTIRPSTAPNLCLAGYGSPNLRLTECVTSYDAYYGPWTQWNVYPGESKPVSLSPVPPKAPGGCLFAGNDVSDGAVRDVNMVTCSADAQNWFYTGDNHIAVTGGNACLSYGPNGALTTQACGNAGVDQVWNLVAFGGSSTTPPPDSTAGQQIRWSSNGVSGCLTVMDADLTNFGRIAIAECMAPTDQFAYLQRFTYTRGSTKIKVAANSHSAKDFCLDLGVVRRQDGTNLHLYQCVDVPQQQFWITDAGDDHIALEGDNQCIDVRADSGFSQDSPYSSLKDVQSWQCSGGNGNQIFSFDL